MDKNMKDEIQKRRTFAIISHPDAGKTTLTEKFLLYGGAIQQAGAVKGKKSARHAVSDWMEIEKQRGISVTSSVLQFRYGGYCINILDTPGHQDFSEDTYRTLMAADSAVMVIDASKGVEKQTIKLFQVCVMRDIPIFTFINKMDREAKDPYDLMEEIEKILGIQTYPMNWPVGSGKDFKGVYDRTTRNLQLFSGQGGQNQATLQECSLAQEDLLQCVGQMYYQTLLDDVELLDGAGASFDLEAIRHGKITPVFFGSALTNFGVEPFLNHFLEMTTPPLARETVSGSVNPFEEQFSAFVFKIQANMNKAHRDRVAFLRICSGAFHRGMEVYHVQGKKKMKLSAPQQMMAQEREVVDDAYAGDIIGVFDPGIFSIGDTLCESGMQLQFEGIPTFAPEHFSLISQCDTLKRKQFVKGISQIAQEGGIQIFQEPNTGLEEIIVGVVGVLQLDVLEYRLENEYHVKIRKQGLPFQYIRWIERAEDSNSLHLTSDTKIVCDLKGRELILFSNEWGIQWALDHNEGLSLLSYQK